MAEKVYLNGAIVEPAAAQISVFDRGFLYGDSVYETLRVYDTVAFKLDEHIQRLYRSGERIGFEIPFERNQLTEAVLSTREASGLAQALVRIIVTRGSGRFGLDPALASDPQVVVFVLTLPVIPPDAYTQGRAAALVSVTRNLKRALDPQAKTGNYMNSMLAFSEARTAGADDAIMLNHAGTVAEASTANVFVCKNGRWSTPPLEVGILAGITRNTILEVARANGLNANEETILPKALQAADEIFLCSSVREILPITTLDGAAVGDGKVGAGTKRLTALYRERVAGYVEATQRGG